MGCCKGELSELPANYAKALELIDQAHGEDPNRKTLANGGAGGSDAPAEPYELFYARKMTDWLSIRCPEASPSLQLACRAQHFQRWKIPRSAYPATRSGYLVWRSKLKADAASAVSSLLRSESVSPRLDQGEVARVAALIRKENLGSDAETQVLEDVACLVFLDGQLDDFEGREDVDEDKVVGILRKTWAKMTAEGRRLALEMELSERARSLIAKVLEE